MPDPLSLEAEQQDEGTSCPDAGGQGVIGEAPLQQLPAVVVAEQVRRLLARDERDGELAGEPAASGPCQEVADAVAALGVLLVQPAVDVVLAQLLQPDFLLVEPGQQLQGNQDPAAQVTAGRGRVAARGRAAAGSPQQEPVQERADQVRVRGWLADQVVLEPGRDPFEILVSSGQHAGN